MDEIEESMEKYKGLVPLVYDLERQELDEAKPDEYKYAVYLKTEADKVIANKEAENRRLKHALWLLKARYFWILMVYASDLSKVVNPSIIHESSFLANPTPRCMEEYRHKAELYDNARIKCLEKAEEYK